MDSNQIWGNNESICEIVTEVNVQNKFTEEAYRNNTKGLYHDMLEEVKKYVSIDRFWEICDDTWDELVEIPDVQMVRILGLKIKEVGICY